jgi:hypothetical protein
VTEIYEMHPDCWFKEVHRAWLVLVRAECSCGHRTRPHLTLDGAARALILHQAEAGTRVG